MSDENIVVQLEKLGSYFVDTYKDHPQHKEFRNDCSTCFSEKVQIDSDDMMVGVSYDEDDYDLQVENANQDKEDYEEKINNPLE